MFHESIKFLGSRRKVLFINIINQYFSRGFGPKVIGILRGVGDALHCSVERSMSLGRKFRARYDARDDIGKWIANGIA